MTAGAKHKSLESDQRAHISHKPLPIFVVLLELNLSENSKTVAFFWCCVRERRYLGVSL